MGLDHMFGSYKEVLHALFKTPPIPLIPAPNPIQHYRVIKSLNNNGFLKNGSMMTLHLTWLAMIAATQFSKTSNYNILINITSPTHIDHDSMSHLWSRISLYIKTHYPNVPIFLDTVPLCP